MTGAQPLEAREVVFGYERDRNVLDGWTATFPAGAMTALVGPSGRGKSTLLFLLGLMLRIRGGEVLIGGQPTSRLRDRERSSLRASRFGFVFQDAALDPTRTIIDNVTETALYRGADRLLAASRARTLLDRFGVDVPVDRRPGEVSGGQAQRIALCRALLGEPQIVLADEPTGNLDPASSGVVVDALREHAGRGGAVVVVTHSPEVAVACDRVISL
ncbi:ATP-binding cassette domain-containing protein [Galbitalea sp. SE-J8]|uniref:ABC transporter ATP-binding protein n=1 Tax=Galbitalea sp. SE-J8 TaxID=3054952 RepID=UPI00259D1A58|nr:ATP-binding cassette domain-containing protein [Galbitalea sp. SE-J8]MDM4762116.1 ATP-binding cassette domain-containing protein [Galbitalea sp. SE-J8]